MSVMRMCETDAGTWILGSHEGDWSYKPLSTRQYVLRSSDLLQHDRFLSDHYMIKVSVKDYVDDADPR